VDGGIDRELDGGGMDMYPDQARAAINGFDQAVFRIEAKFKSLLGEIAGLDSQLGTDRFSADFAVQYQPFVDQLVPQVNELNKSGRDYAGSGHTIVNAYVQQDKENKATIQNAGN
jgi:hypothetical protein